jgi:hypothetical protein
MRELQGELHVFGLSPTSSREAFARHIDPTRSVEGTPADRAGVRNGVMGSATRPGRDQGRAVSGGARDAMDARGLQGFGEAQRRQECKHPYSLLDGRLHLTEFCPVPRSLTLFRTGRG